MLLKISIKSSVEEKIFNVSQWLGAAMLLKISIKSSVGEKIFNVSQWLGAAMLLVMKISIKGSVGEIWWFAIQVHRP